MSGEFCESVVGLAVISEILEAKRDEFVRCVEGVFGGCSITLRNILYTIRPSAIETHLLRNNNKGLTDPAAPAHVRSQADAIIQR